MLKILERKKEEGKRHVFMTAQTNLNLESGLGRESSSDKLAVLDFSAVSILQLVERLHSLCKR